MLRALFLIFVTGVILAIIGLVGLIIIPTVIVSFGLAAAIIVGIVAFILVCGLLVLLL